MTQVFTTRGWLPADQVVLVSTVTHDDERIKITRTDKYLATTMEWVGNDLHGEIKQGHDISGEQFSFA